MNELIAKRYAKALRDLIPEKELSKQLPMLQEIQKNFCETKVAEFVNSPLIRPEEKFDILVKPLKDKLDKRLYNMLEIMSSKGRLNLIPELTQILTDEIKYLKNQFDGIVEADSKISKAEITKLEKVLANYSGAKIKLKQTTEDNDGLKVVVEDLGLEMNLSKSRLKSELLNFIQRAL